MAQQNLFLKNCQFDPILNKGCEYIREGFKCDRPSVFCPYYIGSDELDWIEDKLRKGEINETKII